ncbi:hypothetical protein LNV09_00740 [Paucibacter sp. B2R-40]|uniref:hypothetical protein n=1 Tax=Paucibacter sp. B2R-40 TaxID=2893554 RepID=UPI0021E460A6|nr:hypothetical protein [Paucibacter sp. B2R-40]MCV2352679.1 hypothetical protein [Paucibacter sp. B2R-40]
MTRLQTELQRLYDPQTASPLEQDLETVSDQVRIVVLALAGPADWTLMARVWRGAQADLALPAPAIAVSGVEGYLLCFSFAEPQPHRQALAFAEALRLRYLDDVDKARVVISTPDSAALPPRQIDEQQDHWSAFVAPDLAPVFSAEPWLDIAPSREGQADLLSRLDSIQRADFSAAMARLGAAPGPAAAVASAGSAASTASTGHKEPGLGPERFLLKVMNDESVALALRIEAAKALLQAKK